MYNSYPELSALKFGEKLSCITRIEFFKLLFLAFNLIFSLRSSTFVQFFVQLLSTKNMNLFSLHNVSKDKIYTEFSTTVKTRSHKNVTKF